MEEEKKPIKICLDARRLNEKGGIGRVTAELLLSLKSDLKTELHVLCQTGHPLTKDTIEIDCSGIGILSLEESQKLPEIIAHSQCKLFISPQFYAPLSISIPVINWVHDTWPILHPEWLPNLTSVFNKYGENSRAAGSKVVMYYEKSRKSGLLFPENQFLKEMDQTSKSDLHRFIVAIYVLNIARAYRIVTCSENSRQEIIELFPEVNEKLKVIYNPLPDFVKTNPSTSSANSHPIILHVSKWEARKNIPNLIKAFEVLHLKYPEVELRLVGSPINAKYGAVIFNLIETSKASENIKVFQNIDDQQLRELYNTASAFVMPSFYEGFSIPVLESLAFQLPAAVSRRGAIPEIAGNAALYFNPDSIEDMASCMEKVLFDELCRSKLKKQAISQVEHISKRSFSTSLDNFIHQSANAIK